MNICWRKDSHHGRHIYIRHVEKTSPPWGHIFGMDRLGILQFVEFEEQ